MTNIQILSVRGCPSTTTFCTMLAELIRSHDLDATVQVVVVDSARASRERGLYGSPTILVNGAEYQQWRRGPAGFYSRAYVTADGIRPLPSRKEFLAFIEHGTDPRHAGDGTAFPASPVLVTADWCPYSRSAIQLWRRASRTSGVRIREIAVGTREGDEIVVAGLIAGTPCLIAAPGLGYYGVDLTAREAKTFLSQADPSS